MTGQIKLKNRNGTYTWYDIPESARYIAQDLDGEWYAFQNEPECMLSMGIWANTGGDCSYVAQGREPKDPQDELYEIHWTEK